MQGILYFPLQISKDGQFSVNWVHHFLILHTYVKQQKEKNKKQKKYGE